MGSYIWDDDVFNYRVGFRYMVNLSTKKEKLSRTKKIIFQQ